MGLKTICTEIRSPSLSHLNITIALTSFVNKLRMPIPNYVSCNRSVRKIDQSFRKVVS